MNLEKIKKRVEAIEKSKDDAESAHSMEDALLVDFVSYVSDQAPQPFSDMAKEVLKTQKIDFERWCA